MDRNSYARLQCFRLAPPPKENECNARKTRSFSNGEKGESIQAEGIVGREKKVFFPEHGLEFRVRKRVLEVCHRDAGGEQP